jgi:hypothetical protein
MIDDGNSASRTLVDIGNIVNVIDGHVVVNIRDLYNCHAGICNVNVLHVPRTGAIPRNVYFSGRQREPTHSATDSDAYAKASPAHERN